MHLEAVLELEDAVSLLNEFTPIKIHLAPPEENKRWLELESPRDISFVPGRGLRAACSGRVRLALAGLTVPIGIRHVTLVLEPKIRENGDGTEVVSFFLEIEEADLVHVPDLIDRAVVSKVNAALAPRTTHMVWGFGSSLTAELPMPGRLQPLDQLEVLPAGGEVEITETAVRFRIHLDAHLTRHEAS